MKKKKRSLVIVGVLLTIVLAVVVFGVYSGDKFLGMVKRLTAPSKTTTTANLSISPNTLLKTQISPIIKDKNISLLKTSLGENEVLTKWDPGKFRDPIVENKVRLYPFPVTDNFYKKDLLKLQKSVDIYGAKDWEHIGIQGTGVVTTAEFAEPNTLLIGTEYSGLYKSTNFGNSWIKLNNFPSNKINNVGIDKTNSSHYLVTCNESQLYESNDAGNSWTLKHTFLNPDGSNSLIWNGYSIFVNAGRDSIVSEDNGASWGQASLPSPTNRYIAQLKINQNGQGLYLDRNKGSEITDSTLYLTQDNGYSWDPVLTTTGDIPILNAFDITSDGSKIVVAAFNPIDRSSIRLLISNDLGSTWNNIDSTGYYFWPQDVIIDEIDHNKISLFIYMLGLYISDNGGLSFINYEDQIESYDVVLLKDSSTDQSHMLIPLDLRFGNMFDIKYKIDPNCADQNCATKKIYILPTDQGLFTFDTVEKKLKNIAQSLYLAETGTVTVNQCRIYAGLWHVGSFFIDNNGNIEGRNINEKIGSALGPDNGCDTPVLYGKDTYYNDGKHIDPWKMSWIRDVTRVWNNFNAYSLFQYNDGWWYVFGNNNANGENTSMLLRLDIENEVYDIVINATTPYINALYIEKTPSSDVFWIVDNEDKLWSSTDLINWNNSTIDKALDYSNNLFVDGSQLLISGNGLLISQNGGINSKLKFPYAAVSNVIKDNSGRLFVGIQPSNFKNQTLNNQLLHGVWYSIDNGNTWKQLGSGTEKSYIKSLAFDEVKNILYAGTNGEGILKFDLNINFPVIKPVKFENIL